MAAVEVRFHDNPEHLWVALAEMLERPAWHRDALCAEPGYKSLPWVPSEGERPSRAATVQMQSVCGQ